MIRGGSLRGHGHVMRKTDEDNVKKMYGDQGRRPVVRPRKTWLGNLEPDMAELEIKREEMETECHEEEV